MPMPGPEKVNRERSHEDYVMRNVRVDNCVLYSSCKTFFLELLEVSYLAIQISPFLFGETPKFDSF